MAARFLYATLVADPERYRTLAWSGIPTGAKTVTVQKATSAASGLNMILDACPDVDGLVVLHEDLIIRDPNFERTVARVLAEPAVGLVGAIGACDPPGLAWWDASVRHGAVDETRGRIGWGEREADVDVCDGLLHVIGRRALEAGIRYDEGYDGFHGYDLDLCETVRSIGLRVVVAPVSVDHRTKTGYGDWAAYQRADERFRAKWTRAAV